MLKAVVQASTHHMEKQGNEMRKGDSGCRKEEVQPEGRQVALQDDADGRSQDNACSQASEAVIPLT